LDAVALFTSREAMDELVRGVTARDFVADAFQHCKFIGYVEAALPLLDRAGISDAHDEGTIAVTDQGGNHRLRRGAWKTRLCGRENLQ
jgi:catalase